MIDVCLLGTGGMMPLPNRWLTSLMLRYDGGSILVDCGEGTQIAMKEKGWSPKPIDLLLITHFHADHISGLPGLLLTMGNAERTEPLTIAGPKGLSRVVGALRVVAPELPFDIQCYEFSENEQTLQYGDLRIKCYRVHHNVICYGYSFELDRAGRFSAERAKELDIPLKFWNRLQKGEQIQHEGRLLTPDMVLGPPRKGIKVTYCTDTRPTDLIVKNAMESDLFICEGMYGEEDKLEKAKEHRHMTMYEAAQLAVDAKVSKLWLTHYSPSLVKPEPFMKKVRKIFAESYPGKDGMSEELRFIDE